MMALLPFRCAVIQATRDNYLAAARARTLFGSDTGKRRLYAIDARNHRFSGRSFRPRVARRARVDLVRSSTAGER